MDRVLITGSLGYIGTVLRPYLQDFGHGVSSIDIGYFKDCSLKKIERNGTEFKSVKDISKKDLKYIDVIVHLAGIANDPLKTLDPQKVYSPERKYTNELAKMAKELNKKFIFASSCSVYGASPNRISDEESVPNPVTPYSMNKLQIEKDLEGLSDKVFKPISLRFSTVYGYSSRIRFDLVINMFVGMGLTTGKITLNSKGEVWRPFVHIQDVCSAIKYTINYDFEDNDPSVLNVGDTSENYMILDIAKIVKKEIPGSEISFLSDSDELIRDRKVVGGIDQRDYKISFEKIKKTLRGFSCKWNLKKGIQDLSERFKEINLDEETFKNTKFYRLQHMEQLLENGFLNDDLTWR